MPRIVIAAGGTAGHVVPALAIADELRASGAEVSFIGTRERVESELVPAAGYEISYLKVAGLDRRRPDRAFLRSAVRLPVSPGRCACSSHSPRCRARRRRLCRGPGRLRRRCTARRLF